MRTHARARAKTWTFVTVKAAERGWIAKGAYGRERGERNWGRARRSSTQLSTQENAGYLLLPRVPQPLYYRVDATPQQLESGCDPSAAGEWHATPQQLESGCDPSAAGEWMRPQQLESGCTSAAGEWMRLPAAGEWMRALSSWRVDATLSSWRVDATSQLESGCDSQQLERGLRPLSSWRAEMAPSAAGEWMRPLSSWRVDATPQQLESGCGLATVRCLHIDGWVRGRLGWHVSNVFLGAEAGHQLAMDFRWLNPTCLKSRCEMESKEAQLRRLAKPNNWCFSFDLEDSSHHLRISPTLQDYTCSLTARKGWAEALRRQQGAQGMAEQEAAGQGWAEALRRQQGAQGMGRSFEEAAGRARDEQKL
ncbi:hypothetical protein CYMTET_53891 [Cymbomonas tetramitiformis]|uniref:Uncharacterized protein n=1 Tax=Cymbomonas tetramitiformis TaxID=36881 RepID=A0AAE0BHH9_9CHLO|nr:hypothetical protein CYMTET_53891 [Cymbomonas tetramitiformis]